MKYLLSNMRHIRCVTPVYSNNFVSEPQSMVSDQCLVSVPNYGAIYPTVLKQRQILQILSACCKRGQSQILMTPFALMYELYQYPIQIMNLYVFNIESQFYVFMSLLTCSSHCIQTCCSVPQCTSPIPHGAPFCNGDVHVCTSLLRDGV